MGRLKAAEGRIIVTVDMDAKNWHTFSFGMRIRHERGPNNLNYRETQPVQGEVVDSAYIPAGSAIAFQHNAAHPYYQIFNLKQLSSEDGASSIKYFAIPETACYLYRPPGGEEWLPLKGFATALRVFKPYKGLIQGIEPERIKDHLYITSGHLRGHVVQTLRACDYQIVCMGLNGQEENIIRIRHWEKASDDKEGREEVTVVHHGLTDMVNKGELYVGITLSDAKALDENKRIVYFKPPPKDKKDRAPLIDEIELRDFVDSQAPISDSYDQERLTWLLGDEAGQWPTSKKL